MFTRVRIVYGFLSNMNFCIMLALAGGISKPIFAKDLANNLLCIGLFIGRESFPTPLQARK